MKDNDVELKNKTKQHNQESGVLELLYHGT